MIVYVTPLFLLLVGLLVYLLPTGKAQSLGLVSFAVGLLLLAQHMGPSVSLR